MNAFDNARAAMLAEAAKPRPSWKRHALMLTFAAQGTAQLVLLVAWLLGRPLEPRFTVIPLFFAAGWLAFSAAQPGKAWSRWVGAIGAFAASLSLVLTRDGASEHLSGEYLCTVSHVAAALPAVGAALWLLRGMAPSWPRALCAGLAAGVTGALLGELLCAGDALHVLRFHLSAWAGLTALVVLVSSRLKRTSWAP